MTVDSLPDIWFSRDLPILREVARRVEAGDESLDAKEIATTLGMDRKTVEDAGMRLEEDGYLADGVSAMGTGILRFERVTAKGRREVGQWPNADVVADRLLAALQAAVDQAPEGPEKTKRRQVLEVVAAAGRDFAVQLGAMLVAQRIG